MAATAAAAAHRSSSVGDNALWGSRSASWIPSMPCHSTMLPAAAAESATLLPCLGSSMLFPRTKTNLTICVPLLAGFLGLALLSIPTTKLHVCTKATGWLAWQTHCSWVACWLHACSSCDQSTGHGMNSKVGKKSF